MLAVDHAKESYDSVIFSDHCKAGRQIRFSYLSTLGISHVESKRQLELYQDHMALLKDRLPLYFHPSGTYKLYLLPESTRGNQFSGPVYDRIVLDEVSELLDDAAKISLHHHRTTGTEMDPEGCVASQAKTIVDSYRRIIFPNAVNLEDIKSRTVILRVGTSSRRDPHVITYFDKKTGRGTSVRESDWLLEEEEDETTLTSEEAFIRAVKNIIIDAVSREAHELPNWLRCISLVTGFDREGFVNLEEDECKKCKKDDNGDFPCKRQETERINMMFGKTFFTLLLPGRRAKYVKEKLGRHKTSKGFTEGLRSCEATTYSKDILFMLFQLLGSQGPLLNSVFDKRQEHNGILKMLTAAGVLDDLDQSTPSGTFTMNMLEADIYSSGNKLANLIREPCNNIEGIDPRRGANAQVCWFSGGCPPLHQWKHAKLQGWAAYLSVNPAKSPPDEVMAFLYHYCDCFYPRLNILLTTILAAVRNTDAVKENRVEDITIFASMMMEKLARDNNGLREYRVPDLPLPYFWSQHLERWRDEGIIPGTSERSRDDLLHQTQVDSDMSSSFDYVRSRPCQISQATLSEILPGTTSTRTIVWRDETDEDEDIDNDGDVPRDEDRSRAGEKSLSLGQAIGSEHFAPKDPTPEGVTRELDRLRGSGDVSQETGTAARSWVRLAMKKSANAAIEANLPAITPPELATINRQVRSAAMEERAFNVKVKEAKELLRRVEVKLNQFKNVHAEKVDKRNRLLEREQELLVNRQVQLKEISKKAEDEAAMLWLPSLEYINLFSNPDQPPPAAPAQPPRLPFSVRDTRVVILPDFEMPKFVTNPEEWNQQVVVRFRIWKSAQAMAEVLFDARTAAAIEDFKAKEYTGGLHRAWTVAKKGESSAFVHWRDQQRLKEAWKKAMNAESKGGDRCQGAAAKQVEEAKKMLEEFHRIFDNICLLVSGHYPGKAWWTEELVHHELNPHEICKSLKIDVVLYDELIAHWCLASSFAVSEQPALPAAVADDPAVSAGADKSANAGRRGASATGTPTEMNIEEDDQVELQDNAQDAFSKEVEDAGRSRDRRSRRHRHSPGEDRDRSRSHRYQSKHSRRERR